MTEGVGVPRLIGAPHHAVPDLGADLLSLAVAPGIMLCNIQGRWRT